MLLVTYLTMSFPFGSAEIQMRCTIHTLEIPGQMLIIIENKKTSIPQIKWGHFNNCVLDWAVEPFSFA